MIGKATTEDVGRSGRKSAVLVDEYAAISARIKSGLEINLRHVSNCVHRNSTPRGLELFKQIRDKKTTRVHTWHWTQNPECTEDLYYIADNGKRIDVPDLPMDRRSPFGFYINEKHQITDHRLRSSWYDAEVRESLNPRQVAQELDISYIGSGYCRFHQIVIEHKSKKVRDGLRGRLVESEGQIVFEEAREGEDFEVEVWEFPHSTPWDNYSALGVDTAEGKEHGDFCSADMIVKDTAGEAVGGIHAAALHGHWKPDIFATKLNQFGRWYYNALMVVERNKDGFGILLRLEGDLLYKNLFYEKKQKTRELGFLTTANKKYLVTGDLDEALRTDELISYSINHFSEMSVFEEKDGKLGATGTNNDDRVISLSLAEFGFKQLGKIRPHSETAKVKRKKIGSYDFKKY